MHKLNLLTKIYILHTIKCFLCHHTWNVYHFILKQLLEYDKIREFGFHNLKINANSYSREFRKAISFFVICCWPLRKLQNCIQCHHNLLAEQFCVPKQGPLISHFVNLMELQTNRSDKLHHRNVQILVSNDFQDSKINPAKKRERLFELIESRKWLKEIRKFIEQLLKFKI